MKSAVLMTALAVVASACVGFSSDSFHARNLTGTRIELQPGAEVEIPIRLDAPGRGSAELSVETWVVSDTSQPPTAPVVELHPGDGEVEDDPTNPMRVRCVGNCRGEHRLVFSLPAEAAVPVTVDWSVNARVTTDGSWHSDQLVLEAQPVEASSDWDVVFDSTEARLPTRGSVVRLHFTAPTRPTGLLRMEVPASAPSREVTPVLVSDTSGLQAVSWGSSVPLAAPQGCGPELCDWSVVVAAVGSWRVGATSSEFDISVTPLDQGLLTGQTRWRDTISGDEAVELKVEVTSPPGEITSLGLEVQVILWSISPGERSREPVTVMVGPQTSLHDQRTSEAPMVLIPMACDADSCHGSARVVIDATSWSQGSDLELWVRAAAAAPLPVSGRIEVEVRR